MTASGWMKMETSPAGAPFRNHSLRKLDPGRIPVFRCSSRTSIALKFSQMSCSGYRPLKDIFPLRGAVRAKMVVAQMDPPGQGARSTGANKRLGHRISAYAELFETDGRPGMKKS